MDATEITNRHGAVVESYRYDAFGAIFEGITAPYNTTSYTGHQFDNMTGLMDMKARWYDPESARFLTEDTWAGSLTQPYTQNRYAYVGNNPINMWDPTGNVPEWVRSQSNYTVRDSYREYNYSFDQDDNGKLDDFEYSEYHKDWYEFDNYSESWGQTQYVGRQTYKTYYVDSYEQKYYESWDYTYHEEYVFIHNWLWGSDWHKTTSTTFSEISDYEWSETVTATELAAAYEAEKEELYGPPPAHATKKTKVSINGTQLLEYSSMDGTMISAGILINGATYSTKLPAEQQIIYNTVNSFISSVTGALAPTDYISDEDEAAAMSTAGIVSQKQENEKAELLAGRNMLIDGYKQAIIVLEKSVAVNKQLLIEIRELKSLHQQEYDKIVELIQLNEEILNKIGSLITLNSQLLDNNEELSDIYSHLGQINSNVATINSQFLDLEIENTEPGAFLNTLEHLVLGRESSVQTKAGTRIETGLSLLGLDAPLDIRDIYNDFDQWEWSFGHAGQTGLDIVSVAPVVGIFKKLFNKVPVNGGFKSVDDILSDATTGRATKGKTTQYEKTSGNFEQANKEFDALNPSNVKDIETKYGPGKTGTLQDGRTIIVRNGSSDGRPTLEIRNTNGRGIEIRYGEQSR